MSDTYWATRYQHVTHMSHSLYLALYDICMANMSRNHFWLCYIIHAFLWGNHHPQPTLPQYITTHRPTCHLTKTWILMRTATYPHSLNCWRTENCISTPAYCFPWLPIQLLKPFHQTWAIYTLPNAPGTLQNHMPNEMYGRVLLIFLVHRFLAVRKSFSCWRWVTLSIALGYWHS